MSTLLEVATAMADALGDVGESIDDLQVEPLLMWNPTPPCIDIYPSDPFQEPLTFGGNRVMFFNVRARVGTADREGGQELLLSLMEPKGPSSVVAALQDDQTLGGVVESLAVEGPTQWGAHRDVPEAVALLGCVWRVRVHNTDEVPT